MLLQCWSAFDSSTASKLIFSVQGPRGVDGYKGDKGEPGDTVQCYFGRFRICTVFTNLLLRAFVVINVLRLAAMM